MSPLRGRFTDDNTSSIAALAVSAELDTLSRPCSSSGGQDASRMYTEANFVTYNLICVFTTIRQTPCLSVHYIVMGNSESKTHPREPPVSWRAAIWRRLQIWEELKPYLIRVVNAIGGSKCDMTRGREWESERLITNVSRRKNDRGLKTPHGPTTRSVISESRR
jgi:hypothetical protein